jgi:two-component system LytT family response regulator
MRESGLRVIIVDDESRSRKLLNKLITSFHPSITIIGEAANADTAQNMILDKQPDLVFLDIELAEETGFDLLDRIGEKSPQVIMITAHSHYATKAFRYNVVDYLLKPIDIDQLNAAIKKTEDKLKPNDSQHDVGQILNYIQNTQDEKINRIAIPSAEGYSLYNIDDIIYCQAFNNYTHIYFVNSKTIISSYTLKHYEDLLSNKNFFRVHKSYLVNLRHIIQYRREGTLLMTNNSEIDISRFVRGTFSRLLKEKFPN